MIRRGHFQMKIESNNMFQDYYDSVYVFVWQMVILRGMKRARIDVKCNVKENGGSDDTYYDTEYIDNDGTCDSE